MNKKYKDMTYREFLTDILKINFTEEQLQLLDLFEELKENKPLYYPGFNPVTPPPYVSEPNIPWISPLTSTKPLDYNRTSITTTTRPVEGIMTAKI